MHLPPFEHIKDNSAWQRCVSVLRSQTQLAIDLEANSMFAYQEQVCLIQITVPGQDYIIDPINGLDLAPLGELVEDERVEKIFHAAEYDLILMKRQYGWQLNNLFDTMWAARILGYDRVGLANMLAGKFDLELDKRYQRSNWCARPLSAPQLRYAQADTHYLHRLRDELQAELIAANRLEEATEIFAEQSHIHLSESVFDPDSFWSINGVRDLTPAGKAILKALHSYRNEEGRRRDKPAFKVFGNKTMLAVARERPQNNRELSALPGMSPGQIRRYGARILDAVRDHAEASAPKRPRRPPRPADDVYERYETLHNWRKKRARKRGVESDVILSRDALWALARQRPLTPDALATLSEIGPVRRALYGGEVLTILRRR